MQEIHGVIMRICRRRIRIRVQLAGDERIVIVDPENVLSEDEVDSQDLCFSGRATQG